MDFQRLETLLHRYFDQLLEPAERAELESLLLNHPEARREFWDMARCHALIRFWGEMELGYREAENFQPEPLCEPEVPRESVLDRLRRLRRWWIPVSATAFAALVVFAAMRVEWLRTSVVARITRQSGAQWADAKFLPGQALHRGWLRLNSGAAEIEFSRGARVVVQGPMELRLLSPDEAFLLHGKLNAVVPPPAHGFRIRTPGFSVVDLGTRFGCIVESNAPAEVHVFQGTVSWRPARGDVPRRTLTASQGLKISGREVQSIPANPTLFVFEDELSRQDWVRENHWLQTNAAGLVYLDFENAGPGADSVPNQASTADGASAKVIGCRFVPGRFPGKSAVQFRNSSDRLRLTVSGEYQALTYLTWIRLDGLPPDQASLAMTESFSEGEVHWYIHYDGSFGLGIHTKLPDKPSGWQFVQTAPGLLSTNLGKWVMLAAVFNPLTDTVTDYLDGKPVAAGRINTAHAPLHLDTFEIGNWGVSANDPRMARPRRGHPGDMIRNLNGAMDQFAILSTALSPADIQRIYREGRANEPVSEQASNSP